MTRTTRPVHAAPLREDVDQLERPAWLPREVWPFTLRRHRLLLAEGPVDLHYTDEGVGPVLVLVHGAPWSLVWRDVLDGLRHDFRCITLDLPGSGLSGGWPRHVHLATQAQVVRRLLDDLHVERATFVLHGLAGVAGIHAAVRARARVEGLVAIDASAGPLPRALDRRLRLLGSRAAVRVLGGARVLPLLARTGHGAGRGLDRPTRTALLRPFWRRDRAGNLHRLARSAARSPDLAIAATDFLERRLRDRPVLLVTGADRHDLAAQWRGRFPDAQEHRLAVARGAPAWAAPDALVDAVRRWHATSGPR